MGYKKIAFFTFVGILLLAMNNLVHSIYETWHKQDVIIKAQKDLETAQQQNQDLRSALARVSKPDFVESEARDKLLLSKPGEGIIVIPTNTIEESPKTTPTPVDTRPNYQIWWDTFF